LKGESQSTQIPAASGGRREGVRTRPTSGSPGRRPGWSREVYFCISLSTMARASAPSSCVPTRQSCRSQPISRLSYWMVRSLWVCALPSVRTPVKTLRGPEAAVIATASPAEEAFVEIDHLAQGGMRRGRGVRGARWLVSIRGSEASVAGDLEAFHVRRGRCARVCGIVRRRQRPFLQAIEGPTSSMPSMPSQLPRSMTTLATKD